VLRWIMEGQCLDGSWRDSAEMDNGGTVLRWVIEGQC
jgi:hypothetical protein